MNYKPDYQLFFLDFLSFLYWWSWYRVFIRAKINSSTITMIVNSNIVIISFDFTKDKKKAPKGQLYLDY